MLGGNIADNKDAEMRADNALGDARDSGQTLVNSATQAGRSEVAGATQAGQDRTDIGINSANQFLNPYSTAGTNSLTSLQQLAGPGGPLTNQFSFNPSDLQNDPGYQFTLQQGQDALQRSAAAKGQLFSGGTLKSLAGYTTGTANQYFNDAFNRAQSTFNTNQQQALSRINTLQGLAGMGYNASAGQASDTLNGSQFIANLGTQGAQFGATLGETGDQYISSLGTNTAGQIAGNALGASNTRTTLGQNTGNNISNLLVGQGLANSNAVLGSTGSWLGALNNGTNATLQYLAGRPSSNGTNPIQTINDAAGSGGFAG